jgi:DNA-binding NarL/FixJ family response regulator
VAERVLQHFAVEPRPAAAPAAPAGFADLTAREVEVLRLIARGVRNRQTAEQLVFTEKTVGNHVSNIYSKLQVSDRMEAMLRAREAGLD